MDSIKWQIALKWGGVLITSPLIPVTFHKDIEDCEEEAGIIRLMLQIWRLRRGAAAIAAGLCSCSRLVAEI